MTKGMNTTWTTDPDYSGVGKRCEYDAEGFVSPDLASQDLVIYRVLSVLLSLFGRDVRNLSDTREKEPDLYFSVALGRDLDLLIDGGNVKEMVTPDVMVAPQGASFPENREIVLRCDEPDSVPVMVVEVRSPSTGGWDLNGKMRLYAALGVQEYLLVETGERTPEPELDLYYLRDGKYYRVPGSIHVESARPVVTVFSEISGTHLWLQGTGYAPFFQWFDVDEGHWRDPESNFGVEREAKGRLEQTLLILTGLLSDEADLERVEKHWTATGLPDNAAELVLQVMAHLRQWREILNLPRTNWKTLPTRTIAEQPDPMWIRLFLICNMPVGQMYAVRSQSHRVHCRDQDDWTADESGRDFGAAAKRPGPRPLPFRT